jgi:hypothetical protein
VIEDQVQYEKRLSTQPSIPTTIYAWEIAADFILHTSMNGHNMNAEGGPGVWQCAGDTPTQEEIAANMARLLKYCEREVQDGDDLHSRRMAGEARVPRQSQRQRDCAEYLLLKREWLSNQDVAALKHCQFCTTTIASGAVKCPNCNEIVDRERYEAMKKAPPPPAPSAKFQPAAR